MRHKLIYPILGLIITILATWNIYSWSDSQYWKGIKDTSTFIRCQGTTPWTSDVLKMRSKQVNSCHELEIILNPGYNELAKEE